MPSSTVVSPKSNTISTTGKPVAKVPNVGWKRNELIHNEQAYFLIRDAVIGEIAVKRAGQKYLPMPNAEAQTVANLARYEDYKKRAVFYNVTSRTLSGMVGQIFLRPPITELDPKLDAVVKDADGSGTSLLQQAIRCSSSVVAYGRCGLLVDYPVLTQTATKKQIDDGEVHPTITHYFPWDIINWQTVVVGAKKVLSLLVLRETIFDSLDGYQVIEKDQYRVLYLDPADRTHYVEIWQADGSNGNGLKQISRVQPKNSSGQPLDVLPFTFIGSETNDSVVDKAPLYDLASINMAHYRNSADYEETCFRSGQPTFWVSGLTIQWWNEVLKKTIPLGSWAGLPLPTGATAGILQVQPNMLPMEAMLHKQAQMVSLGAKLVEEQTVAKTATEVIVESTSESSILATCAANVSEAFEFCLRICNDFLGISADPTYQLNKDFNLTSMTPEDRMEVIKEWQAQAITFSEMRVQLARAGVATEDDATAKSDIADDLQSMMAATMAMQSNPANPAGPSNPAVPGPKVKKKQIQPPKVAGRK